MNRFTQYFLITVCSVLLVSCAEKAPGPKAPVVTAQGFDIGEVQRGIVGKFDDIKLRIEAAGRIERLYIKERSYEVDLAKSPEPAHFPLFGLPHRTETQVDITLNFKNYINEKLRTTGPYEFLIEVTDKKGGVGTAALKVELHPDSKEAAAQLTPVESGTLQLQRIGPGGISGSNPFEIEWITTDAIHVTIEIKKAANRAGKLHQLSREDYTAIKTKGDFSKLVTARKPLDSIRIDTANDAATGFAFAVSDAERQYALHITSSATSLSEVGTTVTLAGEYKR